MAGIKNLGMTCYISSLMQAMSVLDELSAILRGHRYSHHAVDENCLQCLVSLVVDYVSQWEEEYSTKPPKPITKKEFGRVVRALGLRPHEMGDPRELFITILHDNLPELQSTFALPMRRTSICNSCKLEKVTTNVEFTITISIGNRSMREGVLKVLSPVNFLGKCQRCDVIRQHTTFLWLENYPTNVCVHNVASGDIEMNQFVRLGYMEYKLLSFVKSVHFESDDLRHYISYKRFPGDCWIENDDADISEVIVQDKIRLPAYVAFYTKYPEIGSIHEPTQQAYENFKETVYNRINLITGEDPEATPYPVGLLTSEGSSGLDIEGASKDDDHSMAKIFEAHTGNEEIRQLLSTQAPIIGMDIGSRNIDANVLGTETYTSENVSHTHFNATTSENLSETSLDQTSSKVISEAPPEENTSEQPIQNIINPSTSVTETSSPTNYDDLTSITLVSEAIDLIEHQDPQEEQDQDLNQVKSQLPLKKRKIPPATTKTAHPKSAENVAKSVKRKNFIIQLNDVLDQQNLQKLAASGIKVDATRVRSTSTPSNKRVRFADDTSVETTKDITSKPKSVKHKSKKKKVTVRTGKTAPTKKTKTKDSSALRKLRTWGDDLGPRLQKEYLKRKEKEKKEEQRMKEKDLANRRKVVPKRGKVNIKIFKRSNIAQYSQETTSSSDDSENESDVDQSPEPNKRTYKYVKWQQKSKSNPTHMSIVGLRDPQTAIDGQAIPGGCLLCSERMYLATAGEVTSHYANVHFKHSTRVRSSRVLMCKCDEIRNRGTDGRMRNRHFHCVICFKPCDSLVLLAKHLFTKHGFKPKEIQHLKYKPRNK